MNRHREAERVRRVPDPHFDPEAGQIRGVDSEPVGDNRMGPGMPALDRLREMPVRVLRSECRGKRRKDEKGGSKH